MAYVIGLTGGIASGKTTIANLFHEHFDIELVDADIIARQVVEPGSKGLQQIAKRYGTAILTEVGTLNRAALREKIFSNPKEKAWLDALLHPMIREQMQLALSQVRSPYALLIIPLMAENNLQHMADRVLVVDVDEQTQIDRTMQRDNISRQQAEAILAAQASRTERLAIADDVIKNDAKNRQLLPLITDLHKKYLAISSANL